MQHHTSRAMYGVMLDAGIEIIEYAPSFLHAKVAVFDAADGGVATVGSSNLDPLSLLLAREANVFVRDDALRRRAARPPARGDEARRRAGREVGVRAPAASCTAASPGSPTARCASRCSRPATAIDGAPTVGPLVAARAGAAGLGAAGRSAGRVMTGTDLVVQRQEGLYCPPGDFYIDPWRPVDRAVITHAHGDHSRRGNAHYLAAAPAEGVLRTRLGEIDLQTLPYGEVDRPLRRSPEPASGRPRARLGAGAARARRARLGRVGRLLRRRQRRRCARGQPDLRAVRAGALRLLHHRVDLRPADLPLAAASASCSPRSMHGGAPMPMPAAPACCSATRSARRSASSRASTARSGRSSCTARSSRSTAPIAPPASTCPRRRSPPRSPTSRSSAVP